MVSEQSRNMLISSSTRQRRTQNHADFTSNSTEQEFQTGYNHSEQDPTDIPSTQREPQERRQHFDQLRNNAANNYTSEYDEVERLPLYTEVWSEEIPLPSYAEVIVNHCRPTPIVGIQESRTSTANADMQRLHFDRPGAHAPSNTSAPPQRAERAAWLISISEAKLFLTKMTSTPSLNSQGDAYVWLTCALMAYHAMEFEKAEAIADRVLAKISYKSLGYAVSREALLEVLGRITDARYAGPVMKRLQMGLPIVAC